MKVFFFNPPSKLAFLVFNNLIPDFYKRLKSILSKQGTVAWKIAVFPSKQGKLNNLILKPSGTYILLTSIYTLGFLSQISSHNPLKSHSLYKITQSP